MHRTYIRKHMEQDRMACLMVSSDLLVFLRDHTALLLSTDANLYKCLVNICLADKAAVVSCGNDCCLIHQVFQICTCKSSCCLGYSAKVYIFT